jgi:hypothetical protein
MCAAPPASIGVPSEAMSAAPELVVLTECPNCRGMIQRAFPYVRSNPGLWCDACIKWAANDDIKIVDVRMRGDRRKLSG